MVILAQWLARLVVTQKATVRIRYITPQGINLAREVVDL